MQFSGAFWSPDGNKNWDAGFDELKKYLQQGNDFCRDIISIMSERCAKWGGGVKDLSQERGSGLRF